MREGGLRTGRSGPRSTGLVLLPGHERHETGLHPENAERIDAVVEHLRSGEDWESLLVLEPREATEADIARAHTAEHIELVRRLGAAGPAWVDSDTPVSPGTYEVTMRAAGAAMVAVDAVAGSDGPGGGNRAGSMFALIRPPGHHATADRAMGFCMFNHAAVAARYAQQELGIERVAILDWDVHHGNGTQDIFMADPSVLFISLHQWPLYPGSGWLEEIGEGEGRGSTVNLPMPPGSGDLEHLEAIDRVVTPILDEFDPGLLIVSAGQDGHVDDPLSHQAITASGYYSLARRAAAFAGERGIGLIALHEGGYNLETLPTLDQAILAGLGDFAESPFGLVSDAGVDSTSGDAWRERRDHILEVQRAWWPAALRS